MRGKLYTIELGKERTIKANAVANNVKLDFEALKYNLISKQMKVLPIPKSLKTCFIHL